MDLSRLVLKSRLCGTAIQHLTSDGPPTRKQRTNMIPIMNRIFPILILALLAVNPVVPMALAAGGDSAGANGSVRAAEEKVPGPPEGFTFLPHFPAFGATHLLSAPRLPEKGAASSGDSATAPLRDATTADAKAPKAAQPTENGRSSLAFIDIAKAKDYKEMDILRTTPKEHKAELFLGFRFLPDTEVLLGKGIRVERTPTDTLAPRDDGWRFKFKANF
jgi:hypothetical protein